MSTNATSIASAISGITDWRQSVVALVAHLIQENECFSSGEIARHLRNTNKKLVFSVPRLGEYVRDLFYGQMPEYQTPNGPVAPVQVSRVTQGLFPDRTPAGVNVFVYGPDVALCEAHEFEVFIPRPDEIGKPEPQPVTPDPQGVLITGKVDPLTGDDHKATVNSEGRLCISRNAFEACVHMGGQPMRGSDQVFISNDTVTNTVTVSQTPTGIPNEDVHSLSAERGRVLFTSKDPNRPFVPGTSYRLIIGPGVIKVDLASAH